MKDYKFYVEWTPVNYAEAIMNKEYVDEIKHYRVAKFYTKDGKYYFKYIKSELEQAIQLGFDPEWYGFSETDKVYKGDSLFAPMWGGLPTRRSENFNAIAEKYEIDETLTEEEKMLEILSKGTGRSMADHMSTAYIEVEEYDKEEQLNNENKQMDFDNRDKGDELE